MSKVFTENTIKKFEVRAYYAGTRTWKLNKFEDGTLAVNVGGELYGKEGLDDLIKGLTDLKKKWEKLENGKSVRKQPARSRQV